MAKKNPQTAALAAIKKAALAYPQSAEDFPWGHSAFKVKGKIFCTSSVHQGVLRISMKLPVTGAMALGFDFAEPTGYGLGKSGWVTCSFGTDAEVPVEMIIEWLDESFRAVAPKRIVAQLDDAL